MGEEYTLIARKADGTEIPLRDAPESVLVDVVQAFHEKGIPMPPVRRRLPMTRKSITHKYEVAGHEGYLTVGLYPEGTPGEMFITMAKEGTTVGGTMDAFGIAISLCLQYGVPPYELVKKFRHSRFEPQGHTTNPEIPQASSVVDYHFRWLGKTFLTEEQKKELRLEGNSDD